MCPIFLIKFLVGTRVGDASDMVGTQRGMFYNLKKLFQVSYVILEKLRKKL